MTIYIYIWVLGVILLPKVSRLVNDISTKAMSFLELTCEAEKL